jgi:hypothetical protein
LLFSQIGAASSAFCGCGGVAIAQLTIPSEPRVNDIGMRNRSPAPPSRLDLVSVGKADAHHARACVESLTSASNRARVQWQHTAFRASCIGSASAAPGDRIAPARDPKRSSNLA